MATNKIYIEQKFDDDEYMHEAITIAHDLENHGFKAVVNDLGFKAEIEFE